MELSKAQDVEAGDGTTTVVVLAGSMLDASQKLLAKGMNMQHAVYSCVHDMYTAFNMHCFVFEKTCNKFLTKLIFLQ